MEPWRRKRVSRGCRAGLHRRQCIYKTRTSEARRKGKKEANRAIAQETHLLRTIPVVPDEDRPVAVAACEEGVRGRPARVPGP